MCGKFQRRGTSLEDQPIGLVLAGVPRGDMHHETIAHKKRSRRTFSVTNKTT